MKSKEHKHRASLLCYILCIFLGRTQAQTSVFSTSFETISHDSINEFMTHETRLHYDLYISATDYAILAIYGGHDSFSIINISSGSVMKDGIKYTLKDKLNGFLLQMEQKKDTSIVFSSCPHCLKGKEFIFNHIEADSVYADYVNEKDCVNAKKERLNYCRQKETPLRLGNYGHDISGLEGCIPLTISEDGQYCLRYYCGKVIFSKGHWSRHGNLLLLQDDNMNEPFYGLILPDGIISRYFIGDIKGKKFYPSGDMK